MKLVHRITMVVDPDMQERLRTLGIDVREGFVSFEVDESEASWPQLQGVLAKWQAVDILTTKFTVSELEKATHLRMAASWHHGYPQPEDDFAYLNASYDLRAYCAECGIGKEQVAPLRMKGEPKWGKKHILQLNWIFDEFLVLPNIWESTFKPFGIGCFPVVCDRTGKELQTVVQLDIRAIAERALQVSEGQACETCPSCGRRKYLPISRGRFPSFWVSPSARIAKTQEYFGSGASAWKAVLISSDLFTQMKAHKLRGVEFIPCEASGRTG